MKSLLQFRNGILLGLFIVIFSLPQVFSVDVEVSVNETSTLKELLSGSYSLQSNGVLEIHNPSNVSKIYEVTIPVELDSLIGFSKITLDNSSSFFTFSFDEIKGYLLGPNETARVGYSFYGLLNYNIYDVLGNRTLFEYYTNEFDMLSKTQLNVQKVEREGSTYNMSGDLINYSNENSSQRLVSAGVQNPTDFTYFARELRLYRNTVENNQSYYDDGDLLTSFKNISIDPFGYEEVDYLDPYSGDNSIYWLSSDIVIEYDLTSIKDQTFTQQQPSSSNGGGSSGGGSYFRPDTEDLKSSILIRKTTDKTVVTNGDEVKVFLTLVNAEEENVSDVQVVDSIPENFELTGVSEQVKVSAGSLNFTIDEIEALSSQVIEYTLKNNQGGNGVTYLQPAEMIYENISYFSDGVLLINNLLPDKRVFVQKEVSFVDDNYAEVTLRVKNLGSITLNDLLIRDSIDENALVKDISEVFFEKGVWKIKELTPGSEWKVTYLVERNQGLESLPNVFGVEQENVFGTMISSGEVVTVFREDSGTVEKIGLMLSVGLLVVYLLF